MNLLDDVAMEEDIHQTNLGMFSQQVQNMDIPS